MFKKFIHLHAVTSKLGGVVGLAISFKDIEMLQIIL